MVGAIVLLCLLLPKINLFTFSGETAGIRVDDFLIALTAAVLFLRRILMAKPLEFSGIERAWLIFFFISLLSFCANKLLYSRGNFLYVIRLWEYFSFFYFGYYVGRKFGQISFNALVLGNVLFMALQYFGFSSGYSDTWSTTDTGRLIGLFGGPYEAGATLNIVTAWAIFGRFSSAPVWRLALIVVLSTMILLTEARVAILAQIVLLLLFALRSRERRFEYLKRTLYLLGIIAIFSLVTLAGSVGERFASLLQAENFSYLENYFLSLDVTGTLALPNYMPGEGAGDASWIVRSSNWSYSLKAWMSDGFFVAIGLGPGVWGPALDGGWIRILTEYGALGLLSVSVALIRLANISDLTYFCVIPLAINMIFVDAIIAYKVMILIFLLAGMEHKIKTDNRD